MNNMNNVPLYHHSYYNYVDNVYPAEEINPLTGELAPFPDDRAVDFDNFLNQLTSQPQIQQSPPANSSRRRFFHYRGKILQLVAETAEVAQPQSSLADQLNYFPTSSSQGNSSAVTSSGQPYRPKKVRRNASENGFKSPGSKRMGNYDPVARSEYVKKWKAGLPQEKIEEIRAYHREKYRRNKEKYKINRKEKVQSLMADPKTREVVIKKFRISKKENNERYRQKQKELMEQQMANMTPDEYQEFLSSQKQRNKKFNERQRQKLEQKIASMTPEEHQKYLEEQKAHRTELRKQRWERMTSEERELRRQRRREYKKKKREEKRLNKERPSQRQPSTSKARSPKIQNVSGTQLHAMLYEFKLGHNSFVAHQNLVKAFGDSAINLPSVNFWFEKFISGQTYLEDEPKVGKKSCKCQGKCDAKKSPPKKRTTRKKKKCPRKNDDDEEEDSDDLEDMQASISVGDCTDEYVNKRTSRRSVVDSKARLKACLQMEDEEVEEVEVIVGTSRRKTPKKKVEKDNVAEPVEPININLNFVEDANSRLAIIQ